jgi:hypothetical protein
MAEQLIRKDSPAAPPRRNTTQTPTIHDAPRRCVGVQPATLEPRVEPRQLPHEDAVKQVERLDRGVVARSKR